MGLCQEEDGRVKAYCFTTHHVDLCCEDLEAPVVLVSVSSNTLESPPSQARVGDAYSLEEECPADMEHKLPRSWRNLKERAFLVWFL